MITFWGAVGYDLDPEWARRQAIDLLKEVSASDVHLERSGEALIGWVDDAGTQSGSAAIRAGWLCLADSCLGDEAALRRRLGVLTDELPGSQDADLIFETFSRLGFDAWDALRGDFACMLWCREESRLILVRDTAGTRPIYYSEVAGGVVFASDLRLLVGLRNRDLTLDADQVGRILWRGSSAFPEVGRTLIDGVRRVPPGGVVEFTRGTLRVRSFWNLESVPRKRVSCLEEAAEGLHEVVARSLDRRLRNGVATGFHLSGGLDSSSLAAMAWVRNCGKPRPRMFSWSPAGAEPSRAIEVGRIGVLASYHGFPVDYLDVEAVRRDQSRQLRQSSNPLMPWTTLELESVVQTRARALGVTAMVSGWGGDEGASFNGKGLECELFLNLRWLAMWRLLRCGGQSEGSPRVWLRRFRTRVWSVMVRRLKPPRSYCVASKRVRTVSSFHPTHESMQEAGLSVRETLLWRQRSCHLVDRIESWYCHGKVNGLQYFYPLLDRDVLEYAISLPGWCYHHDCERRAVFRTAMARYWPQRPKDEKSEPGVVGLATNLADHAPESRVLEKSGFTCFQGGDEIEEWLDLEALEHTFRAYQRYGKLDDLALLGRASEVIRMLRSAQQGTENGPLVAGRGIP